MKESFSKIIYLKNHMWSFNEKLCVSSLLNPLESTGELRMVSQALASRKV